MRVEIPINMEETTDNYYIYADACGTAKEDIQIELKGRVLTIKIKREFGRIDGYHINEISLGNLMKIIEFRDDIDKERVSASNENGLLKIIIPKRKDEAHIIEIN